MTKLLRVGVPMTQGPACCPDCGGERLAGPIAPQPYAAVLNPAAAAKRVAEQHEPGPYDVALFGGAA